SLSLAQAGDAARGRIAIGARLAECFLQLLDHMRRSRQVRIAHAEIDDIGAGIARGRLGLVDLLEHIRRQTADAVKIFHGPRAPDNLRGAESSGPARLPARTRCCPEITPNQSFSASPGTSLTVTLTVEWALLPRPLARASG